MCIYINICSFWYYILYVVDLFGFTYLINFFCVKFIFVLLYLFVASWSSSVFCAWLFSICLFIHFHYHLLFIIIFIYHYFYIACYYFLLLLSIERSINAGRFISFLRTRWSRRLFLEKPRRAPSFLCWGT